MFVSDWQEGVGVGAVGEGEPEEVAAAGWGEFDGIAEVLAESSVIAVTRWEYVRRRRTMLSWSMPCSRMAWTRVDVKWLRPPPLMVRPALAKR